MAAVEGVQVRAARADANQPAVVEALRSIGCDVTHLHKVGEGVPDLLVGYRGEWATFEIKDGNKPPSQRKRTKAQIEWWGNNQHGGPKFLVETPEQAIQCAMKMGRPMQGVEIDAVHLKQM